MKSPAFQFYPSDWLEKKVLRMTDAAQGIYMRLLCYMWNDSPDQCSIEKDDKIISKLLGISIQKWKKTCNEIMWKGDPIFIETDTHYISKRLAKEREKQLDKSEKATKAVNKRWHTDAQKQTYGRNTDVSSGHYTSSSSTTSSSNITPNNKHVEDITAPETKQKSACLPPFHSVEYQSMNTQAIEILHHLNAVTGKLYPDAYPGIRHIIERINDGASQDEMKSVINKKNIDPHFVKNRNLMCPETLFNREKYAKYVMEVPVKNGEPKMSQEEYDRQLKEHVRKEAERESYRDGLRTKNAEANDRFRDKVIMPLKEKLFPNSWAVFIDTLVVKSHGKNKVTLYHPDAEWVIEHYMAQIKELLPGVEVTITGEMK